jgi:site-specific DNA-methyltransferase (adenine-specific)
MRRVSRNQIIFGGNYFAHMLPASRCYLVWWKKHGLPPNSFSECELAWTSFDKHSLVFSSRWHGFVKDSRELQYPHPTQKPLAVIQWAIDTFTKAGDTILDPFLGTGTTAVAAHMLGRNCVGIEQDPAYVAMAEERIANCDVPQ